MTIENALIEALGTRSLAGIALRTLGIPAATLAALRAGTHVVVPRGCAEAVEDWLRACINSKGFVWDGEQKALALVECDDFRAALTAPEPRHD